MARITPSPARRPALLGPRRATAALRGRAPIAERLARSLAVGVSLALATGCGLAPGDAAPAPRAKPTEQFRVPRAEDGVPPPVIAVGKSAKDAKLAFKVTKVDKGVKQLGSGRFGARPAGQYVLVFVTVANRTDSTQTFFGDNQILVGGADGTEVYTADTRAASYLKDPRGLYREIAPDKTVRGVIVFDVPKTTAPTAVELHDSAYSRGVRVTLE
jgi:hypothetical protein